MKRKIRLITHFISFSLLIGSLFGVLTTTSFKSKKLEVNAADTTSELQEIDLLELIDKVGAANGRESKFVCKIGIGDLLLGGTIPASTSSPGQLTLTQSQSVQDFHFIGIDKNNLKYEARTFIKNAKTNWFLRFNYAWQLKGSDKNPQTLRFALTPFSETDANATRYVTLSYTNGGHTYYVCRDNETNNVKVIQDNPTELCSIKFYTSETAKRTASSVATLFNKYWITENNLNLFDETLDNMNFIGGSWYLLAKEYETLSFVEKQRLYCQDELYTNFLDYYNLILERYNGQEGISDFLEPKCTSEQLAEYYNENIDLYCNNGNDPVIEGENSVSSTWADALMLYNNLDPEEKAKFSNQSNESSLFKINFNPNISTPRENPTSYEQYVKDGKEFINSASYEPLLDGTDSNGYLQFALAMGYRELKIDFIQEPALEISGFKITYKLSKGDGGKLTFTLNFTDGTSSYYEGLSNSSDYTTDLINVDNKVLESLIVYGGGSDMGGTGQFKEIEFFGSQDAPSEEIIEMLSKYDYIYGKYGSTIGEDFLGRFSNYDPAAQGNKSKILNIKDINNSTWIIAVVSIIGLTSVGAYFFYRKRKEE